MMKKQNVRTLALIVCTFTYLLIGAAIFDALESTNEEMEKAKLGAAEKAIQVQYNISKDHMDELRGIILRAKPYGAGIQWKFAGAFYFALSVITTIGYGHSTPRTNEGKLFCVAYAFIGIPLNIVMFQSIGERFNIGITIVLKKVKRCIKLKKDQVTQTELTILAGILCTAVLLGGAGAFYYFENWDFSDAFYYCFITMSTIGFGDYVALQNNTVKALQKRPEYVAFSILYILFGLTVFAAALNLMVLRLLTMNTEDERKDELEALAAARGAVKLDGDVITPGTQTTTVGTMGRDVEGMQIEAEDPIRYQPSCLKMQEHFTNSNGIIGNHHSLSSHAIRISQASADFDNDNGVSNLPNGGQENLCTSSIIPTVRQSQVDNRAMSADESEPTSPTTHLEREEIVGLETVLGAAPLNYRVKRRCTV